LVSDKGFRSGRIHMIIVRQYTMPRYDLGHIDDLLSQKNPPIIAFMSENNDQFTTMFLVRHGETAANASGTWQGATNSALNERGLTQAQAIAGRLADGDIQVDVMYSSPLGRATQTAGFIAQAVGNPPLELDPALAEFNLGDWEGLTYDNLRHEKRLWDKMDADPNFRPPGGESAVEFAMRLISAMQSIAARHPGETIVVVSHGGAIATALSMLIEQDGTTWQRYQMANCGLTNMVFDPAPRLVFHNDTAHLDGIGAIAEW